MNETNIDPEQVRTEHMASIHRRAHWAYLLIVLGGGFLLMLLLIAALAGPSG